MVEKELEKYSQTAPKLVEMVPKRCRNALSGGLQEALEGSRRPLGGLREGSRGGVGRLQGRFSLFGGCEDGLRGRFWQTFSDILSKSVWQTRGRAENASKNALLQPGTRQFLNVLSSLRFARFGTTGAQTDMGKKPEFHQRVVVFCTDAKDSKRRTRSRRRDERAEK